MISLNLACGVNIFDFDRATSAYHETIVKDTCWRNMKVNTFTISGVVIFSPKITCCPSPGYILIGRCKRQRFSVLIETAAVSTETSDNV